MTTAISSVVPLHQEDALRLHHLRRLIATAEAFLEFMRVERGNSPATVEAYKTDLHDFLQRVMFDGGLTEWQEVTHRHLRGWLRQLADESKAQATVRRRIAAVRSLWKFLLRE